MSAARASRDFLLKKQQNSVIDSLWADTKEVERLARHWAPPPARKTSCFLTHPECNGGPTQFNARLDAIFVLLRDCKRFCTEAA